MISNALKASSFIFLYIFVLFISGNESAKVSFPGRYVLTATENFDAFLQELGGGFFSTLLLQDTVFPEFTITKNPKTNTYTMTDFDDKTFSFKNGTEFKIKRDDHVVRGIVYITGNKWIQRFYKSSKYPEVKGLLVFGPKETKATFVANDVVTVRKYRKV